MIESNEDRKAAKLRARIIRQHRWRVQVWAQTEQRIAAIVTELEGLGHSAPDLFKPNFKDPEKVDEYTRLLSVE